MTAYAFALRVPPAEPFPEELHGEPSLALVACHCGAVEAGEAALEPLAGFGEPFVTVIRRARYTEARQAAGVRAAYGGNLDRLARIKGRWDPENLFRGHHDIPPRP